jgi:adenosylhomocysteine nucleosidase
MSAQRAIDQFRLVRIVFSGVGGGVDPALHVGDVVVPEQWAEYLEMTFARQTADGFARSPEADALPGYGMMSPNPVTVMRRPGTEERRTWFPVDPGLLRAARTAAADLPLRRCAGGRCLDAAPRIVVGGDGVSGPAFVDNAAFRRYAFTAFHAEVLDMETAAVAHVAYVDGVPFIAFRSLSDLAGGDPGPNPFQLFVQLAADNSAAAVRRFLRALP